MSASNTRHHSHASSQLWAIKSPMAVCRFFGSARGCRNLSCPYLHIAPPGTIAFVRQCADCRKPATPNRKYCQPCHGKHLISTGRRVKCGTPECKAYTKKEYPFCKNCWMSRPRPRPKVNVAESRDRSDIKIACSV